MFVCLDAIYKTDNKRKVCGYPTCLAVLDPKNPPRHFTANHPGSEQVYLTKANFEKLPQEKQTMIQNQNEKAQSKSQRKRDQKLVKKTEKKLQKVENSAKTQQ